MGTALEVEDELAPPPPLVAVLTGECDIRRSVTGLGVRGSRAGDALPLALWDGDEDPVLRLRSWCFMHDLDWKYQVSGYSSSIRVANGDTSNAVRSYYSCR